MICSPLTLVIAQVPIFSRSQNATAHNIAPPSSLEGVITAWDEVKKFGCLDREKKGRNLGHKTLPQECASLRASILAQQRREVYRSATFSYSVLPDLSNTLRWRELFEVHEDYSYHGGCNAVLTGELHLRQDLDTLSEPVAYSLWLIP